MNGMASLERPTIEPENSAPIYRGGDLFVNALAKQLTVPESFFNVHRSADRSALGKDIQDPKTWVEAVAAKDDSRPLVAAIDVPGKIFTRFASQGEFPQNLNPNSIEGVYVSLLLGEAKLKVVRSLMPDAYATGRHLADQAIKETQRLRREFVKNPRAKDLNSLLIKKPLLGEAGQINGTFAGAVTVITVASLILSACAPVQATKTPESGTAAGPRLTETAEAARYTAQSRDVSADVALIKAGQAVPAAATAMPEVAGTANPRQKLVELHATLQEQARTIPGMENVAEPQIQSFLVTDKLGPDESVVLTQNPDTQQVYIINRYAGDTVSEKIDVRAPYYSRITMGEKGDYTELHTYYRAGGQEVALIDWTDQGFEFIGVDGRRMPLPEITMYLGETKGGGALFSPVPSGAEFYAGLPAGSVIDMEAGTITDSNGERLWVIDQGKWVVEVTKEYPICAPENFRDCEISVEELFDGTYFHWLETLSQPFDQSKIKDVPFWNLGEVILYNEETAPNFDDPSTAPFRRDVTIGMVFLEIEGVRYPYIVKPIEFFDKNEPEKNKWVITVDPFGDIETGPYSDDIIYRWGIQVWQEEMNVTPILTSAISLAGLEDPLVKQTFDNNPDMQERFDRFTLGDVSALSEQGIVLLTTDGIHVIFR